MLAERRVRMRRGRGGDQHVLGWWLGKLDKAAERLLGVWRGLDEGDGALRACRPWR